MTKSTLRRDAEQIYSAAIRACLPDESLRTILQTLQFGSGRLVVAAVGKAAWTMADTAWRELGNRIDRGIVVTKYGHSKGDIPRMEVIEAGHPIVDENSFLGAQRAIETVSGLNGNDTVLFLLSGGGSALFEYSPLSLDEIQDINRQMLACGAGIHEINTIRKRLSKVKGGRFALMCAPARVVTIALSDIIDDRLDMIASGPACPDLSTCEDALRIVRRYGLSLSPDALAMLRTETPKALPGCRYIVCGSVKMLCGAAQKACEDLGYETQLLTDRLDCAAREAGEFLGSIAATHSNAGKRMAFIAGGETVVRVIGSGLGGRNQELALAAGEHIKGIPNAAVFSIGSDGTDGPTDAAGGYVDAEVLASLGERGLMIRDVLDQNDSYHALKECGGLIVTGPTGTNVNDLSVALIDAAG